MGVMDVAQVSLNTERAKQQGAAAFFHGQDAADCPYSGVAEFYLVCAWQMGWSDAQQAEEEAYRQHEAFSQGALCLA